MIYIPFLSMNRSIVWIVVYIHDLYTLAAAATILWAVLLSRLAWIEWMNCCLHEVSSTVSFFIYTPATAPTLVHLFLIKWPVMNCSIRTDYLHLFIFLPLHLFIYIPLLLLPLWHIYSSCCCFMSIMQILYPCCCCFLNLHDWFSGYIPLHLFFFYA